MKQTIPLPTFTFIQFSMMKRLCFLGVIKPHRGVSWPRGYKTFSCSAQLRLKFILFIIINV